MDFLAVEASARELVPVLLGSAADTYDVSHTLYRAFGVISHVFCPRVPLSMRLSLCTKFHKIPKTSQNRLLSEALLDFAEQQTDTDRVLCLIPCSRSAAAVAKALQGELESHFVFLSAQEAAALCKNHRITEKGGHAI